MGFGDSSVLLDVVSSGLDWRPAWFGLNPSAISAMFAQPDASDKQLAPMMLRMALML